jgi:hypothetical protein
MGLLIWAIFMVMYICFKIAWHGTLLLITMAIFLITACFGRATWVRF